MNKLIPVFNNPIVKKIFILIFIIIAIWLLIQTHNKIYRDVDYDFISYLLSAKALLNGANPYHTGTAFPFVYPLFLAMLLIPLSILPYWLTNFLWFGISLSALLFSVYFILRMATRHKGLTQYIVPLIFLFILFFGIVQNNLLNGQVNFLVLFFCVLFLKYFQEDKNILSAFFLAAGVSIKIVPVIFLVFLIFRRRYGTIILTLLFTAALLLLPVIFLGREIYEVYAEYIREFLADGILRVAGRYHSGMFFTLHGFISYIFPALAQYYWIKVVSALIVLLSLMGFEFAFIRQYRGYKYENDQMPMMNSLFFCLYLIAGLLISPLSEKHHLILLFPALCIIWISWLFKTGKLISVESLFIFLFLVCFYIGQGFKYGPFYFFAVAISYYVVWENIRKESSTPSYRQPFSAEKMP